MAFLSNLINKLTGKSAPSRSASSGPPMRVFVLDDDEERLKWFKRYFSKDQVDTALDVPSAIEMLDANDYDAVFLDHDLLPEHYGAKDHDDEHSGYAVAHALAQEAKRQRSATIIVHSLNPDGALRMTELLHGAGYATDYIPFTMLEHRLRKYWQ